MGNESEQMWGSYPRAGLKCHSKDPGFYHLCIGGSLQISMEFALSVNGFIYRDISQSHGDGGEGTPFLRLNFRGGCCYLLQHIFWWENNGTYYRTSESKAKCR